MWLNKKGRAAGDNPANRFESIAFAFDPEEIEAAAHGPKTQYLKDTTRSIISYNKSPDIPFTASFNPYRGCEHGCIYCYARPTHEYLGFSLGLDFESKILVKLNAPELLRAELSAKNWQPTPLALSGITDAYQPVEKHLQITRRCLQVLLEFRNPVSIITKNHLVTRDIDILSQLAKLKLVNVFVSVTTLQTDLARVMEPRAATPKLRLDAVRKLSQAGIPTGVMMAPVIPGLTDHEIPRLLQKAAQAGACSVGHTIVRLPYGLGPLFENWLTENFSAKKEKILNRIKSIRGGKLNDPRFGKRMRGEGAYAEQIHRLFSITWRKLKVPKRNFHLVTTSFRNPSSSGPEGGQKCLFV